jgi:hypothetical protein
MLQMLTYVRHQDIAHHDSPPTPEEVRVLAALALRYIDLSVEAATTEDSDFPMDTAMSLGDLYRGNEGLFAGHPTHDHQVAYKRHQAALSTWRSDRRAHEQLLGRTLPRPGGLRGMADWEEAHPQPLIFI